MVIFSLICFTQSCFLALTANSYQARIEYVSLVNEQQQNRIKQKMIHESKLN